jgi:arylsulfatase A-like enzyme
MIRSRRRSLGRAAPALAVIGLALGALACGRGEPTPDEEPAPKPNLVLVVIDTLRPDHLGTYGYERETAPFLAALAERSTVFDRAYSTSSWTAPSTATLFTGMYPNRHGVLMGFRAHNRSAGEDAESLELISLPVLPTLAEQLEAAGYSTFAVGSNVNVGVEMGFDRGFGHFERFLRDDAEVLAERVLSWREELAAGPSFLYLHFNDVHKPYVAREPYYEPAEGQQADVVARYDSEITYLDGWLERLYGELGWDENTIVMVVSDHGEEFSDHGGFGHGYTLYRELNQVVMMIFAPGLAPEGARVGVNVSLVDVLPTLRDAAGLEPFDQAQGRSLLPLVTGAAAAGTPFEERTLFAHRIRGRDPAPLYERAAVWSAIRGRWKLIRKDKVNEIELYDLLEDPGEQHDLSKERPELVAELSRELERFERETERLEGARVEVEVDEDLFEHLEELGYTGDDG